MVIYMYMILIVSCAALFLIGILFRIAGTLRLSVPLLYALVVAFFFPGWSTRNPALSMGILYGLIGLCVLSWIVSLIRKIREHRAERALEEFEARAIIETIKRKQGTV